MREILTGLDHQNVERWAWEQVKYLPCSRRERLLWRNRLYLGWLEQHAKQEAAKAALREEEGEEEA